MQTYSLEVQILNQDKMVTAQKPVGDVTEAIMSFI